MDRIGHYLADVCRDVREQAKANRSVIAAQFNASEWTVRRFEMQKGKWSAQTDELVEAYAKLAGVEPPDLWQRAIDRWREAQAQAEDDHAPAPPPKVPKAPRPAAQKSPAKRHQGAGS